MLFRKFANVTFCVAKKRQLLSNVKEDFSAIDIQWMAEQLLESRNTKHTTIDWYQHCYGYEEEACVFLHIMYNLQLMEKYCWKDFFL